MSSPQLRVAHALIAGFNAWDISQIGAQLSDAKFRIQILPASLERPAQSTKRDYLEYLGGATMNMFQAFHVEVLETIESPGKVFFHTRSTGKSTTDAPYADEYMIVLTFDGPADNPKICEVKEFVDSWNYVTFFPAERERQAKKVAGT